MTTKTELLKRIEGLEHREAILFPGRELDQKIAGQNARIVRLEKYAKAVEIAGQDITDRVNALGDKNGIDQKISEDHARRIAELAGKYTRMDAAIHTLADARDKRIAAPEHTGGINDMISEDHARRLSILEDGHKHIEAENHSILNGNYSRRISEHEGDILELKKRVMAIENKKPGRPRKGTK